VGTDVLDVLREVPDVELRRRLFDAEANVRLLRSVIRERGRIDRERASYEEWLRGRQAPNQGQ
jgi:hypothetical protein